MITDKHEKKLLKKLFKQKPTKPIAPLYKEPRCRGEYEYCEEYGFLPFENMSDWLDEDVEEYIEEYVEVKYMYMPWDCTGQIFTRYVSWHRNPNGMISFVNHMAMDV